MLGHDDYRGITRALQVLTTLNKANGSSVTEISRQTGISRTALYRILNVLSDSGYIRRRGHDLAFVLTSKVKMLSDGFRDESWISEIAAPVMDQLQREVVWPTDLATFRDNEFQLIDTTRRRSPLVIDEGLAGYQFPSVLRTALGLAYISFAEPAERDSIINRHASNPNSTDLKEGSDPSLVAHLIAQVRANGYASRFRGTVRETGTIAVPILYDMYSIASLGITFFASALTVAEAAERHLPALKRAANEIERKLHGIKGNFRRGGTFDESAPAVRPATPSFSTSGSRVRAAS